MQELRLVAVSEDGTYLVLATAGRGTRFTLPVDDRLRAAVRGHFSRLGQFEIEVESPLRPKEIQARIRSGETAEEIAESAGIPVERVRWFEGPVLQEREYMAQQAQRVSVRRPGESTPGPPLGETVEERLGRGGVDLDEAEWDSWKCEDNTWRVRLSFFEGGRPHAAEWTFDPRRRHVSPLDEIAARLTSVEWDDDTLSDTVTPLVPRRPAMKVVGSDRDVRGLPADPGQPGPPEPLRAAESREYAVERGRMTDPRAGLREREPAETASLREAAAPAGPRPGEPSRSRDEHDPEAHEETEPRARDLRTAAQAPAVPRPRREDGLGDVRQEARAAAHGTREYGAAQAERSFPAQGESQPHDEFGPVEEDLPAASQASTASRPHGARETGEAREGTRDQAAPAGLRDAPQASGTARPGDGRPGDGRAMGEGERSEREPGAERESAQGAPAAAEGRDAAQPSGAARPRDEAEAARAGEASPAHGEAEPGAEPPGTEQQDAGIAAGSRDEREHGAHEGEESRTGEAAQGDAPDERAAARAGEAAAKTSAQRHDQDEPGEARQRAPIGEAQPEEAGDVVGDVADRGEETGEAAEESEELPREAAAATRDVERHAVEAPDAGKPAQAKKPPPPRQPARAPAKKKPATRPTMPAAQDKPATGSPAAASGESAAPQRPARRRKAKGKRASVPSWDEIMFGARRPE